MRINKSTNIKIYIFTVIFCTILTIANASGYPKSKDDYMNDFAGIIGSHNPGSSWFDFRSRSCGRLDNDRDNYRRSFGHSHE